MGEITKINRIVKELGLDKKFPHKHTMEGCYSYDGHRSDLDCSKVETPHACSSCAGHGKTRSYIRDDLFTDCSRCRGLGVRGGDEEARKLVADHLKYDLKIEKVLSDEEN